MSFVPILRLLSGLIRMYDESDSISLGNFDMRFGLANKTLRPAIRVIGISRKNFVVRERDRRCCIEHQTYTVFRQQTSDLFSKGSNRYSIDNVTSSFIR